MLGQINIEGFQFLIGIINQVNMALGLITGLVFQFLIGIINHEPTKEEKAEEKCFNSS